MPNLGSAPMPPDMDFALGVALFVAGFASLYTGKTLSKYKGMVSRAKNPEDYWVGVAFYFLLSAFFVWLFWSSPAK